MVEDKDVNSRFSIRPSGNIEYSRGYVLRSFLRFFTFCYHVQKELKKKKRNYSENLTKIEQIFAEIWARIEKYNFFDSSKIKQTKFFECLKIDV